MILYADMLQLPCDCYIALPHYIAYVNSTLAANHKLLNCVRHSICVNLRSAELHERKSRTISVLLHCDMLAAGIPSTLWHFKLQATQNNGMKLCEY